jgi:hypothetical protein
MFWAAIFLNNYEKPSGKKNPIFLTFWQKNGVEKKGHFFDIFFTLPRRSFCRPGSPLPGRPPVNRKQLCLPDSSG